MSNYFLINFTKQPPTVEDYFSGEISEQSMIDSFKRGVSIGKANDHARLYRKEPLEQLLDTNELAAEQEAERKAQQEEEQKAQQAKEQADREAARAGQRRPQGASDS